MIIERLNMYLDKALEKKKEITAQLLQSRQVIRSISFAGTDASALTIETLPGIINGCGIAENNGEYFIKLLLKDSSPLSLRTLQYYFGLQNGDLIFELAGPIHFKKKIRPPFPGVSIGHLNVTAGTLGCYVTDKKNNVYILSNNHILADSGKGKWKDIIIQPGSQDGGTQEDNIATLSYVVPLNRKKHNYMDAALAKIDSQIKINTAVQEKYKINGTADHTLKMKVEKFGRTTAHTVGEITTTHLDVNVEFEGIQLEFHDQFEIKGAFVKGSRVKFCNDGDSGSLILQRHTHRAIGLLFAGTKNGTTYASPINEILDAFSVNIL